MRKILFLKKIKTRIFFLTGFLIFSSLAFLVYTKAASPNFDSGQPENINLTDGGIFFELISKAPTVGDFLNEQQIFLNPNDVVFPEKDVKIYSGTHILILRAKKITIREGGRTFQIYTLQNTVEQAVWENKNIPFSDDDIANPGRQTLLQNGIIITIIHVLIKEETKQQSIDYKTISNEDDTLSWRIKKVTQKGIKGIREIKYRVVYYDGKEISRKILESNDIKDPTDEIVTQGTYVKTGKAKNGQATWYKFKGGLFAASLTLPRGAYAKVTNADNGKSVIVQINDSGPYGKGRIIDLDKIAFQKIADLGAGVINVKVEQVLN